MSNDALVDRIAALPAFQSVPREELEWMVDRGELRQYALSEIPSALGSVIDEMAVLLRGRVALYMDRGGPKRKLMEALPGQVLGVIPYSRINRAPGSTVVEEEGEAFVIHRKHFPSMIFECPELTAALVHHMLDRARNFSSAQLNDDRLQSLGRLASGLAHELNNPASAATRNAQTLAARLDDAERAAWSLSSARLDDAQLAALADVRKTCASPVPTRTALEAADREDEISEWLARHRLAGDSAEALAASSVTIEALERLANVLPAQTLDTAVCWIAAGAAARTAVRHIETATSRIHDLVGAVRGFTFMDREAIAEEVDIARGLTDTIAVLEGKARAKGVTVRLETADGLPRVHGVGSEINQVWNNLIDNAIDAVDREGHVTITASSRSESVFVRVADDGPGVPDAIRTRLFDPFFTTKPVGKGTGLGLDIARRAVHVHGGDVDFTSVPGRTVFRVRLPLAGMRTTAPAPRPV